MNLPGILMIALASAGILTGAEPPAPASPDNGSKVTLQLKWFHQFQFAGYYAAQQQGFYRDEGLDVTIVEGALNRLPLPMVLQGRATYGITGPDLLVKRIQGAPVVALAAVFQHSPYIVMTRLDRGIRRPADLRGRSIMVSDTQSTQQVKAVLLRDGVRLEEVKFVTHSWTLDELIAGKVDAIAAYSTVEPALMRARGVEPGMIRIVDYDLDFYGDVLFTEEREIRNNPARVEAFRRASMKGWEYAFNHVDEMVAAVLAMPGVKERGVTARLLQFEAEQMRQLVLPNIVEIGHMSAPRWEKLAGKYADLGLIPGGSSVEGFLYQPHEVVGQRWIQWLTTAGFILLVVSLLTGIWGLQLRRQVDDRTIELEIQNGKLREEREALAKAEANYRSLFDLSNDAILVFDAKNHSLMDVNGRAVELFGHEREEILRGGLAILNPVDAPAIQTDVGERLERMLGQEIFETRCMDRWGRTFWIEASLQRGTAFGGERILAQMHDITERRRAEDERIKVSKVEALGVLAGGLAHDLNNIMMGITLNLQLVEMKLGESGELTPLVREASSAAFRASELSRRMLTFARGGDPIRKVVAVGPVIQHALELSIRGSNLLAHVDIAPGTPPVLADPHQLAQVIDNLVINAREASPHGGDLWVRCRSRYVADGEIGAMAGREYVEVEVEDRGTGIRPEVIGKIFDPYFTTKEKGSGIGLTTCFSIIKKHGGTIIVRSELGRGTTFTLYLPVAGDKQGEADSAKLAIPAKKRGGSGRILIVDDEETIRLTLTRLLMDASYEPTAVSTAEEGHRIFAAARKEGGEFQAILLDATIPGGSGGEVAFREFQRIDPAAKVIIMSGYSNTSVLTDWQKLGFRGMLPKPFKAGEMLDLLGGILS